MTNNKFKNIFENIYFSIYCLYRNWFMLRSLYVKIKFLIQRIYRGFDDSETWSLDWTLYNWLLPRLKAFRNNTNCWPDYKYKTFKNWTDELDKRIKQLEYIVNNYDEFDLEKNKEIKNFNKWLSKDINELWW